MENEQCPICNAELEEIVITDDKSLTWQQFTKKVKKQCEEDDDDECIYFHSDEAKRSSRQFRTLNCMINNCPHSK